MRLFLSRLTAYSHVILVPTLEPKNEDESYQMLDLFRHAKRLERRLEESSSGRRVMIYSVPFIVTEEKRGFFARLRMMSNARIYIIAHGNEKDIGAESGFFHFTANSLACWLYKLGLRYCSARKLKIMACYSGSSIEMDKCFAERVAKCLANHHVSGVRVRGYRGKVFERTGISGEKHSYCSFSRSLVHLNRDMALRRHVDPEEREREEEIMRASGQAVDFDTSDYPCTTDLSR